VVVGADRVVT